MTVLFNTLTSRNIPEFREKSAIFSHREQIETRTQKANPNLTRNLWMTPPRIARVTESNLLWGGHRHSWSDTPPNRDVPAKRPVPPRLFPAYSAVFLVAVFFAGAFLAGAFLAVVFFAADLAVVFFAVDFFAVVFLAGALRFFAGPLARFTASIS